VVTTAPKPVLFPDWVPAGAHVCAATGFRDVDKECARAFDKWVVGWYGRDLEWIEGSEVGKIGGLQPGDLGKGDIHADLATEIMLGTRPGRERDDERTIMTHMGMPALDAAVASLVYDLASSGRGPGSSSDGTVDAADPAHVRGPVGDPGGSEVGGFAAR
jgi:ornithine cyclodeaminase